jgi:hypothetical protein
MDISFRLQPFYVDEVEMKLSFDWFISKIHEVFEGLPDHRKFSPNRRYSMKDAALGAFAMFFSQSPSFLAYQQAMQQVQRRNNAQSIFGVQEIPSDNQIRNLLDPTGPELFYPVFSSTFEQLEKAGHLNSYRFFEGCLLVPLDGTEYFRSSKIHCSQCSVTHHTNGKVSYSHKVLTPVVVAPGNPKVLALEPEFIVPKARAKNQDCELNAAKRWVERHAALAATKVILLGDDLFSKDPFCKALLTHGFHFILVCKPDSHKTLYEEVAAFEKTGDLQSFSIRTWNGRFHERATYRYMNQLPLNGAEAALEVNWVELTLARTDTGEVLYKNAFITDFPLTRSNVPQLVQAGRARWKVENENTNVLKTKGYHLEHNYGHGHQFLSTTLLTLNLLAFLAHTFLELVDTPYRAIRQKLSARKTFFHDFTTLTKYVFFESWSQLMAFMVEQLEIELADTG